jgi:peptidoglycan/LPS O-acetylase OafA/YrhL
MLTPGASAGYIRPLDGLRCFAVFLVIWQHSNTLLSFGAEGIGIYGVWLFFVLSGFLITGILLRERDRVQVGMMTFGEAIRTFYVRRLLRIFPAYYLLLFIIGITAIVPSFRRDFLWYATYLSNWMMAARGSYPGGVGHLWSLAVEEQFYLVWPLLILLVPARHLPRLFVGAIVFATVSRFVIAVVARNGTTVTTPTVSNLDSLALGALLAWHVHHHADQVEQRRRWLTLGLLAGCAIILVNWYLSYVVQRGWLLFTVTEATSAALIGAWLVNQAASSKRDIGNRLLSWSPIAYLGKISYGLYLYHFVLIYAFRNHDGLNWISQRTGREGQLFFVVVAAASILSASVSWHFFERGINSLKRFYPYA